MEECSTGDGAVEAITTAQRDKAGKRAAERAMSVLVAAVTDTQERRVRRRRRRCAERGASASVLELMDQYERYASQIWRILKRKGAKWHKAEAVRRKQRRCLIMMLRRPTWELPRALQRVQRVVCVSERVLKEFERGEHTANIYVQVHPGVKHTY